jgi:hypothetical protein
MRSRGAAACRGTNWARRVARSCARSRPWPRTEKAHRIARTKVADLTRDKRLAELLADECARYAEREWTAEISTP